jgi:hypothetical protein
MNIRQYPGGRMKAVIFLLVLTLLTPGKDAVSEEDKPLPELNTFLQNVRRNLHTDQALQSRYTYTEKEINRQLDSRGDAKKIESRIWEVYPSAEPRLTYRKLIRINDGVPSAEQIEKNDRAYDKRRREWEHKQTKDQANDRQHREAKEAEAKRKEEETLNEAFGLYQFTMIGREPLEGISAIVLTFEPRVGYKPKTRDGEIMSKVHGRVWISEADYQLIRVDAELRDAISFGLGVLARINKGTRIVFQRRKINDEIWLPAMSHLTGTGKILLFKGLRIDQETTFSDYKKYSVATSIEY